MQSSLYLTGTTGAGSADVAALVQARLGVMLPSEGAVAQRLQSFGEETAANLEAMVREWGRARTAKWVRRHPEVLRIPVQRQVAVLSALQSGLGLTRERALEALDVAPVTLRYQPDSVSHKLAAVVGALGPHAADIICKAPDIIARDPESIKEHLCLICEAFGLRQDGGERLATILKVAPKLLQYNAKGLVARADALAAAWGAPEDMMRKALRSNPTIIMQSMERMRLKAEVAWQIAADSGVDAWARAASPPWSAHKLLTWMKYSEDHLLRLRFLLEGGLLGGAPPTPQAVVRVPPPQWAAAHPGVEAWLAEYKAKHAPSAGAEDAEP